MKVAAILLCGGQGARFGADKLVQLLGGQPLWTWAARTIRNSCDFLVVVDSGRDLDFGSDVVVMGGATRQESVKRGLSAVPDDFDLVLIHDAARPFVSADLVARVLRATREGRAATAAIRPTDTFRDDDGQTLDRDHLWAIQTPQCARREDLLKAHEGSHNATDDAGLLLAEGIPVTFVEGEKKNIKITTQEDLAMARAMAAEMTETRTGFGYDVHAFSVDPSRPMMLGGLEFEGPGLEGHSDADVLLHAAVDALLGAAGMGDIGVHYPPSDPQWKNCPSIRFVQETGLRLKREGWSVHNLDMTLIAETPRVMSRSKEIREVIALALGTDPTRVNVKATTNEGLGAIGRKEGIAAMAVATLRRCP